MDCPQCGYLFGPFERTCPKCARAAGPPAGPPAEAPPTAPVQADQTYKVCPRCQQAAPLNALGCSRCGYPAAAPPTQPPAAPAAVPATGPGDHRAVFAICGSIVALLLVVIICRSFFSGSGSGAGLTMLQTPSRPVGSGLSSMLINSQQIDQRLALASATTGGDLEISLAWNSLSDLDLQVREPSGTMISAGAPQSPSGGTQDVDANPTLLTPEGEDRAQAGQIPGQQNVLPLPDILVDLDQKLPTPPGTSNPFTTLPNGAGRPPGRFTRTPIEHIFYANAPRGVYSVYAHCYSWREPNSTPLPFTVEVRSHGRVFYQTTGVIGPQSFAADGALPILVCQFRMR